MSELIKNNQIAFVARYNEDISWVEKIDADVIIYNKGEDFPYDYPRIDKPNYGREGHTFVAGIIEFYDKLDDYENVIFLQGNPFSHCSDVINIINQKFTSNECGEDSNFNEVQRPNYVRLTDSVTYFTFPNSHYIIETHASMINIMFGIKANFNAPIYDNNKNLLHDNFLLFQENMAVCEIMKIPYAGKEVFWATGAQYIIPVSMIKSKSINWWISLHNLFIYFGEYLQSEALVYAVERIWPLIWEHEE